MTSGLDLNSLQFTSQCRQSSVTQCSALQCIYFSQCSVVFSQVQVIVQFIELTGQYASWILPLNPKKCEFLCREMLIGGEISFGMELFK